MISCNNEDFEVDDDIDDIEKSKILFIQTHMESGCKIASVTDEYISIKNNRKKLIDKLLSYIPEENIADVKSILDDIDTTYNQQSSEEFDCVLGLIFDRIYMLPELMSVRSLKKTSKKVQK